MGEGTIVTALHAVGELPCYEVPDTELGPGVSLGNGHTWVNAGTDGRIRTFFSADVGAEVAGPLVVRYGSADARILASTDSATLERGDVPLGPTGPGRFVIHPAYQRHHFELPGDLRIEETVFVPLVPEDAPGDETVAYYMVRVRNDADRERLLSVYAFVRFAGNRRTPIISGDYDAERGAIFAHEEENPDWVRALTCTSRPTAHALTDDFGALYDTDVIPPLDGRSDVQGDILGCLETHLRLEAGEDTQFAFVLTFTPEGRSAAGEQVDRLRDFAGVLHVCISHLEDQLDTCTVMTPDPVINEGAFWSRVNMLRVLAHYPQGLSFTNEPGVSSNVVARDAAWFVYGCDHFLPEVSRELLDAFLSSQYANGKMPEYYDARTGRVEDYGLNINDGTPLLILAVNHHVRSTGDFDYLRSIYDPVAHAARYILSQRDERGLVQCTAEGVEVFGICSWRNVIPNYRINGAVTEVNAECAAALRAMGHMADNIGREEEGREFRAAAEELTDAINEHLLDPERGLYLLNLDPQGVRHTDVTADECFPVLFRVADEEVAFRIIRRLNSPDFRTPAGLRTCSRLDPLYDPAKYVGLRGGVWPGLTWWYAFAAARYHPDFMVQALHASYAHYNRHPRVFSTVPGQFSEWFDGESLINRGMRLSPWEPPRFLWAAVEGVCGIMVSPEEPGIRPLIPAEWKWSAVVRFCYHGGHVTAFAARMGADLHVYANSDFKEAGSKDVLERDLTDRVRVGHRGMHPVALADEDRVVIAVGSCRDIAVTTPLDVGDLMDPETTYQVREYSSEKGAWTERQGGSGGDFARLGVRVEARGFHVLEFRRD